MEKITRYLGCVVFLMAPTSVFALDGAREETRTDEAFMEFGVTGNGVTVAVLDRGIAWDHPDFMSGDVISKPWGTLLMEFTGPDSATASWTSVLPGYSDGSLELTRLTGLGGHACADG